MDSDTTVVDSIHLDGEAVNFPDLGSSISPEAIVASSTATRRRDRKETILLVEDEAFVRKAICEALESAGYRVLTAENAIQALQVFGEYAEPVSLLLADIVMPGINGHELARDFSTLCPQTRILLMSGYEEQLTSRESVHRPEYLAKPFSIPMLLRKVREVLDRNPLDFKASA
ncbi:MAG: response regulator [Candidatus Sulfotelmatobacter sp.]